MAQHEPAIAFSFITAGVVGMTLSLSFIRIALYGTTARAAMLTVLVSSPGFAIAAYGYLTDNIVSSLVAYTLWYLCIAYFDHRGIFKKARGMRPANEAS